MTGQTVDETCSSLWVRVPGARIDKRAEGERRVSWLRTPMMEGDEAPIRTEAGRVTPHSTVHASLASEPDARTEAADERYGRTSMRSVFFATTLRPSVTWKVSR